MNILILGASGLAGSKIYKMLRKDYTVYGTCFSHWSQYSQDENMLYYDISDPDQTHSIIKKTNPQIVISCMRGEFTQQLNAHRTIANYCSENADSKFIYMSTANVFDKLDRQPHYEDDITLSDSDYGNFKIKCEEQLRYILDKKLVIIRVPFIWSKKSLRYQKLIEAARRGDEIQAWSNLFTNHTTDEQIASYVKYIIENDQNGIVHIGTSETCNYLEFLKVLLQALQLPEPIFSIENIPYKSYLAVLSSRKDVPEKLQLTNSEVIHYLTI